MLLRAGCIPVIVRHRIRLPYEPELDYSAFAVVVGHEAIPHLPSLLANISTETTQRMRLRMAQVHRMFLWDPSYGTAFESVMRAIGMHVAEA